MAPDLFVNFFLSVLFSGETRFSCFESRKKKIDVNITISRATPIITNTAMTDIKVFLQLKVCVFFRASGNLFDRSLSLRL